jgi:prepilin-type N-terminal cleavage/methylation domain-containing protein
MKNKISTRSGFTLIELLTVIAIIGILAAILIPAVGKVKETANKMRSSANIRSIAVAYATYSSSSGRTKTITRAKLTSPKIHAVAEFLAKQVELTDASIWIIDSDPKLIEYENEGKVIPAVIGYRDSNNTFQRSSDWNNKVPLSYDFALAAGGNDPPSTTPLTWTRGLSSSGNWGKDSPWGLGGHIAFLDAHVSWYNDLEGEDGQLVNPSNGTLTNNILNVHSDSDILRAD